MSDPVLVGVTSGDNLATVTQHANTQVGDYILVFWGAPNNPNSPTFTPDAGAPTFTRHGTYDLAPSVTTNDGFFILEKGVATEAGASVLGTISNGDPFAGYWICVVTRGSRHPTVAPEIIVNAPDASSTASATGLSYDVPAITPDLNNALLVAFAGTQQDSSTGVGRAHTVPTGFTERAKINLTAGETGNTVAVCSTKQLVGQKNIAQSAVSGNLKTGNISVNYRDPVEIVVAILPVTAPTNPAWNGDPDAAALYDATVPYALTASTDTDGDAIVYDIEKSTDGSSWSAALTGTTSLTGTIDSSAWTASSTWRLRVRARDAYGSVSGWVTSPIFEVAHTSYVKIWNGSAWVLKPLKRWNGSAWVGTKLKRWTGSAWVQE